MRKGKIWILAGCVFLSIVAFVIYQREFTFDVNKLTSDVAYNEAWAIPQPPTETMKLVQNILSQKLTYLGRGAQCYAFVTPDGQYVVKLFKHHHLRRTTLLDDLPIPPSWFREYRRQKAEKRRLKQEHLFASCRLAYLELPEETGLIYVQLNKGHWPGKSLVIRDRFGKDHTLDLASHEFMVQRRGFLAVEAINSLMLENKVDESQQCIQQILTSLAQRCNKGIVDLDPAFNQNFGITATGAMQIDVGRFERDSLVVAPPRYGDEIRKISNQFRQWLEQNHPTLLPFFDQELARILKAKEQEFA